MADDYMRGEEEEERERERGKGYRGWSLFRTGPEKSELSSKGREVRGSRLMFFL